METIVKIKCNKCGEEHSRYYHCDLDQQRKEELKQLDIELENDFNNMERIEKAIKESVIKSQKNSKGLQEIIDKLKVLDPSKVSEKEKERMDNDISEIEKIIKERREFLDRVKYGNETI